MNGTMSWYPGHVMWLLWKSLSTGQHSWGCSLVIVRSMFLIDPRCCEPNDAAIAVACVVTLQKSFWCPRFTTAVGNSSDEKSESANEKRWGVQWHVGPRLMPSTSCCEWLACYLLSLGLLRGSIIVHELAVRAINNQNGTDTQYVFESAQTVLSCLSQG